jgi:predicted anti-sigma-YlaC factor YlaD
MTAIPSPDGHLDPHEVAAYLSGTSEPVARARVEAHLADCEQCTAELVAVRRLHRGAPRGRSWLGAAAAAAAVIAVVLIGPRLGERPAVTPPVRGDSTSTVVSLSPRNGATLVTPVFAWRPVAGATAYRITITRADGDSVWAASVRDTSVRVPDGALVPAPDGYFWYVDALLADGRSIAGSAHEFRLGP